MESTTTDSATKRRRIADRRRRLTISHLQKKDIIITVVQYVSKDFSHFSTLIFILFKVSYNIDSTVLKPIEFKALGSVWAIAPSCGR